MLKKVGPTQEKILLLLLSGVALGSAGTLTQSWKILDNIPKEWKRINQANLRRSFRSLSTQELLEEVKQKDGTTVLQLTEAGRKRAKYLNIFGKGLKVAKPAHWDKYWRIVLFDIPEKKRQFRDILREHLKDIGFHELQHSVFIFPYPCEKEIGCLVDLYGANQYVRILTVKTVDNQKELRKQFFRK
ncbi:MAG: hypothetical protein WAT81_04110 [Candidatus Moraniibacteriota bacterium]